MRAPCHAVVSADHVNPGALSRHDGPPSTWMMHRYDLLSSEPAQAWPDGCVAIGDSALGSQAMGCAVAASSSTVSDQR